MSVFAAPMATSNSAAAHRNPAAPPASRYGAACLRKRSGSHSVRRANGGRRQWLTRARTAHTHPAMRSLRRDGGEPHRPDLARVSEGEGGGWSAYCCGVTNEMTNCPLPPRPPAPWGCHRDRRARADAGGEIAKRARSPGVAGSHRLGELVGGAAQLEAWVFRQHLVGCCSVMVRG